MLENRSFDNVLGWLYDPQNAPPFDKVPPGQKFDGVSGQTLTNRLKADTTYKSKLLRIWRRFGPRR